MEIGKKLKKARVQSGLTQENVAEKINVSRQAISNWENEKSYPDIISVIELSNLYSISLDDLLKGDEKMIEHLEESTNVVKSNQKMIWAIIVNIIGGRKNCPAQHRGGRKKSCVFGSCIFLIKIRYVKFCCRL